MATTPSLISLISRAYYTLTNVFLGGEARPPCLPPQYTNGITHISAACMYTGAYTMLAKNIAEQLQLTTRGETFNNVSAKYFDKIVSKNINFFCQKELYWKIIGKHNSLDMKI